MDELIVLIYLLVFIIGSLLGLLISYKKHTEPFIINNIDIVALIISIIGWILLINYGLFDLLLNILGITSIIIISIALFLIGFVIGMRPGYGRYETGIGILISITIYFVLYLLGIS